MLRFLRSCARAACGLLPLALAVACLDDGAVAPPATGDVPLGLRVQLAAAQEERTLRVSVYFLNRQEQRVDLEVSPAEIRVPPNETTTRGVATRIAPCLAEGYQGESGDPVCPLRVHLALVDGEGQMLSEGETTVAVRRAGETVVVPTIVLAEPAVTISRTSAAFVAQQNGGLPAAITFQTGSATGAALGALTVGVASTTANLLTATVDAASGVVTLRPARTDLAPGAYTATVTVSSARAGIAPATLTVTYTVATGGSVAGTVRNAVSGATVAGAAVALYAGAAATGTPQSTTTASATGAYAFTGVNPGTYTVQVSGTGFSPTVATITVAAGQVATQDVALSPTLPAGQWRIVLTWGAVPADLDSHLWGPPSQNAFHLYWSTLAFPPYAQLDVDDQDGFGPETVTILQQGAGTYTYAVHDYTNRTSRTGNALGASGARVQVYNASGLVQTFSVPGQPGTLWTVFTLNGTTITPVNAMSFVESPGAVPPASSPSLRRGAPSPSRAAAAAILPSKPARAPR